MSIESQDTKINNNDNLSKMIENKFGINRENFKKNNRQRLAKMAWVPVEKYTWKKEQNEKIRKRILKNDLVPLQEVSSVIKKFSPQQQTAIRETFSNGQADKYMSSLQDTHITELKRLSPTQLTAFLSAELKIIKSKTDAITFDKKSVEASKETIVILDDLWDMIAWAKRHNVAALQIDEKTGKFADKKTQQQLENYIKNIPPEEYEKLKITSGSEEGANAYIKTVFYNTVAHSEEVQSTLSEEAKRELSKLTVEFCTNSQSMGIDMSSFGLQTLYEKAKAYLIEKYTTTDTYKKLSYNINSAPAVSMYFAENAPAELVPEAGKDKAYYTKVVRWYPALDASYEGKKLSEYLPYFNDDMTIKSEVPDQQKKLMLSLLPQLKEKSKPYEKKLLGMTNSLTQTVAVEQCITTLQSYMDVNISEKENVMQQLNIAENRDAVSENLVVKINGTLNGKKIVMSYDLLTGNVFYQSFLTKQSDTEQSPITIGGEQIEETVPLITLPKFGDFIDASKTIDYTTTIHTCETQDQYSKKITETLENTAKAKQDMASQKDMLKKYILKDMITQNIFSLTGRTTDGLQNSVLITPSSQPQMHAFYNFLSNSLTYYSMGSIDDLQLFQKNIQTLLTYATGPTKTQSTQSALAYKDKNQEMFVMQSLLNQANIPSVTSSLRDQQPEEKLLSFFRCFEKNIGAISVIDAEMMDDFFAASRGTNKEANAVGKRKRSPAFAKLSNDMEKNMESTDADDMLQDMSV